MPGIYDYPFQQQMGSMLQTQPPVDPNAMMNMGMGQMGQPPQLGGQYMVDLLANGGIPRAGASVPQDVVPGMNNLQWYQDFAQQDAADRSAFNTGVTPQGTIRRPSPDIDVLTSGRQVMPPKYMDI